jgi:hypothetical protein
MLGATVIVRPAEIEDILVNLMGMAAMHEKPKSGTCS